MPKAKLYLKECKTLLPVASVSLREENLSSRKTTSSIEMTDSEIISQAQAGDIGCFELLYTRHKRKVFSLCLRMTGNYAEAEDLTQEAFLQLYRKIGSFRGDLHFPPGSIVSR